MSKPKTDSTAEEKKTYHKALKTVTVNALGVSTPIVFKDTVDNPSASRALGQFLKRETIVTQIPEQSIVGTVEVPFHAVEYIEVTERISTPIEAENPYGCELDDGDNDDGGSGDGGSGNGGKK